MKRANWFRVLQPLWWWLFLVLVLFLIHTHQRLMEQTKLYFNATPMGATATLDGRPFTDGDNIALGNHTFSISQPKFEPFTTNFSAWYGRHDFGEIKLPRSTGTLNVSVSPPANTITISGHEFSLTLTNSTGTNVVVPTDIYSVSLKYPHWSSSRSVVVVANQIANAVFNTKFGSVMISSVPSGANVNGTSGDFFGITPLQLDGLEARTMQFNLSAYNYEPTSIVAQVVADTTNTYSVSLVGLNYSSALTFARSSLQQSNYAMALSSAQSALDAKPNDADALDIQKQAQAGLDAQREQEQQKREQVTAEQQRLEAQREEQAQLQRPREMFDAVCQRNPDSALFAEQELKTDKPAKDVAAGIVKSLTSGLTAFKVLVNRSPAPDTYEIIARQTLSLGIFGGMERDALLVVGQPKADETQILFKVLEYQLKANQQKVPVRSTGDTPPAQVREGIKQVTERVQQGINAAE